jgi:hypothetical protein
MRTTTRLIAACLGVLLLIPATASAAPKDGKGQGHQQTETNQAQDCFYDSGELAGTASFSGTNDLWPPNHKYRDATAVWQTADPEDDFVGMYSATHNQFNEDGTEFNGAGNTSDDIVDDAGQNSGVLMSDDAGTDTADYQIRAERAGTDQDGRTYSITGDWTITDSNGDEGSTTCDFEFFVYVPHDQGNRNNQGRPDFGDALVTLF